MPMALEVIVDRQQVIVQLGWDGKMLGSQDYRSPNASASIVIFGKPRELTMDCGFKIDWYVEIHMTLEWNDSRFIQMLLVEWSFKWYIDDTALEI